MRLGSALLWLWYRLMAAGLIRPLSWEPTYAAHEALRKEKGGGATTKTWELIPSLWGRFTEIRQFNILNLNPDYWGGDVWEAEELQMWRQELQRVVSVPAHPSCLRSLTAERKKLERG